MIYRFFRCSSLPRLLLILFWAVAAAPDHCFSQADPEDNGPLLLSVSPLMAQRGASLQVEARGNRLAGTYAVWFDEGELTGKVVSVEEVVDRIKPRVRPSQQEIKPIPVYRVVLELQVTATARIGTHSMRLVSSRGISNAIALPVVDAPVAVEKAGSHQTVAQSQEVVFPGFISGKIAAPGEVDVYAFDAKQGQELRFEVVEGQRFDRSADAGRFTAEVALYHAAGSWFDPNRPTRALFQEERSSDLMPVNPGGTYRFSETARYYLQVSGLFGLGCADCTYQVRVFPVTARAEEILQTQAMRSEWLERSLDRRLTEDWIRSLVARSVGKSQASVKESSSGQTVDSQVDAKTTPEPVGVSKRVLVIAEHEPNDQPSRAAAIAIPSVIEGAIEGPGDLDSFKFSVEAGQKLAFEVETLGAKAPYFNPRIGVVDRQDRELLSNVERRLSMYNNNAVPQVYLKAAQPKATHTFERAGEYILQVRDITSRYGNPTYRYRILVRPQIPHVGEISVISKENIDAPAEVARRGEVNRLNLVRNEPKKLILIASYEEGFAGDLAFSFTGLPEGIQAFPALQFNEGRAPLEVTQNPDTIAPRQQKATMVLVAGPDAPLTKEPKSVQLRCQPINGGMFGSNLLIREFPLMVVESIPQTQIAKPEAPK